MSKQLASLYCITPKGKLFLCFLERIGYMSHINDFVDKIHMFAKPSKPAGLDTVECLDTKRPNIS